MHVQDTLMHKKRYDICLCTISFQNNIVQTVVRWGKRLSGKKNKYNDLKLYRVCMEELWCLQTGVEVEMMSWDPCYCSSMGLMLFSGVYNSQFTNAGFQAGIRAPGFLQLVHIGISLCRHLESRKHSKCNITEFMAAYTGPTVNYVAGIRCIFISCDKTTVRPWWPERSNGDIQMKIDLFIVLYFLS